MADEAPDGAAVFPLIPTELGVHPLLLGLLHAYVFFTGSDEEIVNPDAAEEAMEYLAGYAQRLDGKDLQRVRDDLATLIAFAKSDDWEKAQIRFLQDFLKEIGVDQ